jgi:hypothetical protein
MRMKMLTVFALVLLIATACLGLDRQAFQMRNDFGMEPLSDCALQYYYYIPCPSYSWFWCFEGWDPGDIVGKWFEIGDMSTGTGTPCDPTDCHTLEEIRILDFAGYCQWRYMGLYDVRFDVYCADQYGCPVGPPLWTSEEFTPCFGWTYITIDPPISICQCSVDPGPPPSGPRILVTATHVGIYCVYPCWGFDNISWAIQEGCAMHDEGCLPALYPRPYSSNYGTMHSGYYGNGGFDYCPAQWFLDPLDTTPDGTQYGFLELAWTVYLICAGPTEVSPTSWGNIKSMYR